MIYLSAQPDHTYFHWQVEIQLLNFQELQIPLSNYKVVFGIKKQGISEGLQKLIKDYPEVSFFLYEDERESRRYIPSIRPHILKKFFKENPQYSSQRIFYFDADVVFREEIDFSVFDEKIDYVSDTDSYLGVRYIEEKGGRELLNNMCSIVDVEVEKVLQLSKHGGAQYYFTEGIDENFWERIELNCSVLYNYLQNNSHIYAKWWSETHQLPIEKYHEIQSWCSDMWCVIWELVRREKRVETHKELDFSWGTSTYEDFLKSKIFHNAGVTEDKESFLFYKGRFIKGLPLSLDLSYVRKDMASSFYAKILQKLINKQRIS